MQVTDMRLQQKHPDQHQAAVIIYVKTIKGKVAIDHIENVTEEKFTAAALRRTERRQTKKNTERGAVSNGNWTV